MIWKLTRLRGVVEYLKIYLSLDFIPKITRNSVRYIGSFMGRAVRCHREIMTKRLYYNQKRRKLDGCPQKSKSRSPRCACSKCTGFRYVQKKRVIEPDFLANLAYSRRVCRDNETSMDGGDADEQVGRYPTKSEINYRVDTGKPESRGDHRDLYLIVYVSYLLLTWIAFVSSKEISLSPGETWWNKVIDQRDMPPLNRGPLDKPTRSERSSATSGFRSCTPEFFSDALDVSRSVTPLSALSYEESRSDDCPNNFCDPREGSKSDSKILPRRDDKAPEVDSRPARSASAKTMALELLPKEGRSPMPVRRKPETRRKSSGRTVSHASDRFSTCVKCSRILSRTK